MFRNLFFARCHNGDEISSLLRREFCVGVEPAPQSMQLLLQFRLKFFDLGTDGTAAFVAAAGGFFLPEPRTQQQRRREGDEREGENGLKGGGHGKLKVWHRAASRREKYAKDESGLIRLRVFRGGQYPSARPVW